MDKITDIFQGLKERLNNPLIGSFIIAWTIINWQIPIGIIFYGNETLAVDGYKSKIDLVQKTYSLWLFFWLPFLSALLYTFAFPFVRTWVRLFYVKLNKWSNEKAENIAQNGSIPISKYLQLRSDYKERTSYLQEVIKSESEYLKANSEMSTRLTALQNEKNTLISEKSEIYEKNKIQYLDGFWKMRYRQRPSQSETQERVQISNGQVFKIIGSSQKAQLFRITFYSYSPLSEEFFLVVEDPETLKNDFTVLRPINDNRQDKLHSNLDSIINEMERE